MTLHDHQDPELGALEEALGLKFRDVAIIRQAFTHRSYLHEHPEAELQSNERLEFLGDAIVHFVVADELFRRYPQAQEGELTALRAALVCTPSLARIAEGLDLASYVRASRGEATLHGRGRQSILADALEALVAAVYLDLGLASAVEVVRRLIGPQIEPAMEQLAAANVKGRLQELVQASEGLTPFYRVVERSGPVHAERFVVEVVAGDRVLGRGEGIGKRQAEQEAARQALARLAPPAPEAGAAEAVSPPLAAGAGRDGAGGAGRRAPQDAERTPHAV
jgi:ribonuclease-3